MTEKPLILLDVDGVINDLGESHAPRPWGQVEFCSYGWWIAMPEYMPRLIQYLSTVGDIMWCTTWRGRANGEIATQLGVDPFPVIDDGTRERHVSWKPAAAAPVAARALAAGRRVIWIEDFAGHLPIDQMPPGVEFIDTAANGEYVLRPEHLPSGLVPDTLRAA